MSEQDKRSFETGEGFPDLESMQPGFNPFEDGDDSVEQADFDATKTNGSNLEPAD